MPISVTIPDWTSSSGFTTACGSSIFQNNGTLARFFMGVEVESAVDHV